MLGEQGLAKTNRWGFDGALLYFASGRQNRIDFVTIVMLLIIIVLRVSTYADSIPRLTTRYDAAPHFPHFAVSRYYGVFDTVEFCSSMLQPTACYPAEEGVLAVCQVLYAFAVVGVCLGMGDSVTFFLQDFGEEYYLFIWILGSMFSWIKRAARVELPNS